MHVVNGLPEYPWRQEQTGLWFITLHSVFLPQGLGQGLIHLLLIQALFDLHSALTTHSGRQFGGDPT